MKLVYLLVFILFLSRFAEGNTGSGPDVVEILIWSGGSWAGFTSGELWKAPNYLGHDVDKKQWQCPVTCKYTGDKKRLANVDGVIFEAQPLTGYYDEYKRGPPAIPQKFYKQLWINHGYETPHYFHLYGDEAYMRYIDINMTYEQTGQVPITFHCHWGGGTEEDLLKPHPPKSKDKCVAFMTTNCGSGGATYRTEYAKELMQHMHVDSLGKCLHNTDVPKQMDFPIYSDHGSSMRNKINIFKDYKFVLTFENNNVTDYVTEKMPNVIQAGSVPIYMGSPNVHPNWTPGENSIVRTDDFKGPAHLAEFLKKACADDNIYESFFEWKKKGLSSHYKDKLDKCVFYGAECRLCQYILERRKALSEKDQELVKERQSKRRQYFVMEFGNESYLKVSSSAHLDLQQTFTIAMWASFTDYGQVLLDRTQYRLSLKVLYKRGYLELCVAGQCFLGTHPIVLQSWYHIAVVFNYEETGGEVLFYVNGVEDESREVPEAYPTSYTGDMPLFIGTDAMLSTYYTGQLDDISIWNAALSNKRIQQLVFEIPQGVEEGLVAYWGFNEALSTDTVTDAAHGLDATIVGKPQWHESLSKPLATVNPCL